MIDVLPLARELDEYTVTPGVLGFIVFAVLGVSVWILLKSMSRHLGKVDFPEEGVTGAQTRGTGQEQPTAAASATSATSSASSSSA